MDVPLARHAARPGWLNRRTLLGLVLFGLAFAAGRQVMSSTQATTGVWVAARDLARGATIQAADLRVTDVRLGADVLDRYATTTTRLEGAVVGRPVRAGELIALDAVGVGPAAAEGRVMTVPVAPEHAVGGALRAGDRIDIFATFDPGEPNARTALVGRDVEVINVVTVGGLVVGEEAVVGVTVAIDPDAAATLAFAIRSAEIDIARVDGRPDETAPASIENEDVR